jgi:hypothetical protein
MNQVTVDAQFQSKLNGARDAVELRTEAGETVGHFVPPELYKEMRAAWLRTFFTDEEVARAEQRPRGGRPLAEIWKRLGRP